MRPTGYVLQRWVTDSSLTAPAGPALTTLRSVVADFASLVRSVGIVYTAVQVVLWHSFYAAAPWRLAAPVVAMAWAVTVTVALRRHWPSLSLTCADSAVYIALALGAQAGVPPAVRDDAFGWLVISMSGQILVPVWYAPGVLAALLALASPAAYLAGAAMQPVTDTKTLIAATVLLIIIGLVHGYGRRKLGAYAVMADADVAGADRAVSEQYAMLSRSIERREHERLLHDTVLNTLTALARAAGDDVPGVVNRCRQDVALIEGVLGGPGALTPDTGRSPGDLISEVQAVAAGMRARGLTVHVQIDVAGMPAVPARVAAALSNAAREALLNVAAHAGTGEAWVEVRELAPEGDASDQCRLQVAVRDQGSGFDLARVDRSRLGLRRSIAERVADCGGQASVWSEPGQGTVVRASWPAPSRSAEPDLVPGPADRTLAREGALW